METSSTQVQFESLRILVVDDHAINREFLCSGLGPHCARVDSARSGRDAIERCARLEYDLILMDLHMPELDGLDTAVAIRQLAVSGSDVPIVFLTADVREDEQQRLHSAGFHRVLTKPVSLDLLFRSVQHWLKLDGRERLSPTTRTPAARLLDDESALMACNGRSDLLRSMKKSLARDLDQRLTTLNDHLGKREYAQAADLLHQWIGACGYVGAQALTQRSRTLERALLDGESGGRAGACIDFIRCAQATVLALEHSSAEPLP
jgi:two-component system sensor histidine kinase BarA